MAAADDGWDDGDGGWETDDEVNDGAFEVADQVKLEVDNTFFEAEGSREPEGFFPTSSVPLPCIYLPPPQSSVQPPEMPQPVILALMNC
jgi:hypothetical protein